VEENMKTSVTRSVLSLSLPFVCAVSLYGGDAAGPGLKAQDRYTILNSRVKMTPALGRIFSSIQQDEYNITWQPLAGA
jgi:hypothetical protein